MFLGNIIENLKQHYPKAIRLFTPPLIPAENEWCQSGTKSPLRNVERSKHYATKMVERASVDCRIISTPWSDGCREHQDGVHLKQTGGIALANAVEALLSKECGLC
jgi:hypothetical protein